MKKLLLVLVAVLVLALSGCGEKQPEPRISVTQHETGEVTVCLYYKYEDGREPYTCDLFILDNSDLEERVAALEELQD